MSEVETTKVVIPFCFDYKFKPYTKRRQFIVDHVNNLRGIVNNFEVK
jgi:hypothetical protein